MSTQDVTPNHAIKPPFQQRRFACCCPAAHRERWANKKYTVSGARNERERKLP